MVELQSHSNMADGTFSAENLFCSLLSSAVLLYLRHCTDVSKHLGLLSLSSGAH